MTKNIQSLVNECAMQPSIQRLQLSVAGPSVLPGKTDRQYVLVFSVLKTNSYPILNAVRRLSVTFNFY